MMDFTFEIAGQPANGPVNWDKLELSIDRKGGGVSVDLGTLEFEGADATLIKNIATAQGYFKGIPATIKIQEENDLFVREMFLDLTAQPNFIGCDRIVCQIKERKGVDWLTATADAFSFAFLYDEGVITNSDFVSVPYIVNFLPDGPVLVTLSVSVFIMSKELYELIREISEQIAELINAATPSVGVGVVVDVGDIIWAALKIVARIVYAVFIGIAIAKMMQQIFEQLIQLKRYHKGMRYLTMFQRGCQYLNLNFQSSIMTGYAKDMVYIPKKDKKGFLAISQNYSGVTGLGGAGYPSNDEPIYTFGNFIRVMKRKFNAEIRIKNGTLIFERHDFFEQDTTYVIPDVFTNQERFQDDYSLNTDECKANYNILYLYDTNDQNTLEDQTGRVFQAILSPTAITDNDLNLMHGLEQVQIPFALGKRKNELNPYEKVLKALATAVDSLTGLFGAGTNFGSSVDARIGSMLLSSHQISVPKVVIMKGGKIDPAQMTKLAAKALWDNFHYIDSFKEIKGKHGQFKKFAGLSAPMCLKDFLSLAENQNCDTPDAQDAMIDQLKWKVVSENGTMNFRVRTLYDPNIKITIIT